MTKQNCLTEPILHYRCICCAMEEMSSYFEAADDKRIIRRSVAAFLASSHAAKGYLTVLGIFLSRDSGFIAAAARTIKPSELSWSIPLSDTLFFVGRLCGVTVLTSLADSYGRRISIIISLSVALCGVLLQLRPPTVLMITLTRFLQGSGISATVATSWVLASELSSQPTQRSYLNSLKSVGFALGAPILCGIVALGTPWQLWTVFPAIVICCFLAVALRVPSKVDSPPWLASAMRVQDTVQDNGCPYAISVIDTILVSIVSIADPILPRFIVSM